MEQIPSAVVGYRGHFHALFCNTFKVYSVVFYYVFIYYIVHFAALVDGSRKIRKFVLLKICIIANVLKTYYSDN